MVHKIDNRHRAADNRDCAHPLRHRSGCCIGVGSAPGNREHSKFADTEMIGEPLYNLRPIAQFAIGLQTRPADAWSIR